MIGADDPGAASLPIPAARMSCDSASSHGCAQLMAREVRTTTSGSTFDVVSDGIDWAPVALRVPGLHNVRNALAAIGAAWQSGRPSTRWRPGSSSSRGSSDGSSGWASGRGDGHRRLRAPPDRDPRDPRRGSRSVSSPAARGRVPAAPRLRGREILPGVWRGTGGGRCRVSGRHLSGPRAADTRGHLRSDRPRRSARDGRSRGEVAARHSASALAASCARGCGPDGRRRRHHADGAGAARPAWMARCLTAARGRASADGFRLMHAAVARVASSTDRRSSPCSPRSEASARGGARRLLGDAALFPGAGGRGGRLTHYVVARGGRRRLRVDTPRRSGTISACSRAGRGPAGIRSSSVGRSLPGHPRRQVTEAVPVALAPTAGGFEALQSGRVLPLSTRRARTRPSSRARTGHAGTLRLLAGVRGTCAGLFARISDVRRMARRMICISQMRVARTRAPGCGCPSGLPNRPAGACGPGAAQVSRRRARPQLSRPSRGEAK